MSRPTRSPCATGRRRRWSRSSATSLLEAARAARLDPVATGGIGVGVAGQCLGATGVVLNAPNLGWRDVAFGELLRAAVGVPIRIANDLSVAAWGEKRFGAAKGIADVVLVFVGSGVGSGLILGGRLHEGAQGVAGEFGHVKVRSARGGAPPRPCGCGQFGCLEAYTSGMNVAARVREEIAAGAKTSILAQAGGDPARVTASLVDDAYRAGDPYARALWDEVAELLGMAVANLVTLLNPTRLILGGGVLLGCPSLAGLVRERFDAFVSRSATKGLTIERAWLGDDAGVIGAAVLEHQAGPCAPALPARYGSSNRTRYRKLVATASAPRRAGSNRQWRRIPAAAAGPSPCPGSSTTRASAILPVSSTVTTSTTTPSMPSRDAPSGYSFAGRTQSPIGRGSTVTCVGGTYLSLRYGFTSEGAGAVLGTSP